MLDDMSHNLDVLQCFDFTFTNDSQMEESLVSVFADFITFWVQAVDFLRRGPIGEDLS
jgi:hypothetical protein